MPLRAESKKGALFAGCLREGARDARALAGAFQAAAQAIATYGGAAEGDRTMLDALLPAARAMQEAATSGQEPDRLTILPASGSYCPNVVPTAAAARYWMCCCPGHALSGGCMLDEQPCTSRAVPEAEQDVQCTAALMVDAGASPVVSKCRVHTKLALMWKTLIGSCSLLPGRRKPNLSFGPRCLNVSTACAMPAPYIAALHCRL